MSFISLAWLQLIKEPRRLLAATAGITFAVMLMLVQLGFEQALFTSVDLLYAHLRADLVMISPLFISLNNLDEFSERRLYEVSSFPEVRSVSKLYLGPGRWKNPITKRDRLILLIGFRPQHSVLDVPGLDQNIDAMNRSGIALFDINSRPEYGPIAELVRKDGKISTEVNGERIDVGGLFQLGTSFVADGNLIVSDMTFHRILPSRREGLIDVGLIHLKPGADAIAVRDRMNASLKDGDVKVITLRELLDREKQFWATSTPIGFVFRLGLLIGVIVGIVVVYQILFSDVSDHMDEYATLKAIGYSDRYLHGVVVAESLFLSIFGFLPGLAISQIVYVAAKKATRLPMQLSWDRVAVVYGLTVIMCAASGMLAMRKLKSADPAEIF